MAKKDEKPEDFAPHIVAGNLPYFGDDAVLHLPGDVVYAKPSAAGDNLEAANKSDTANATPANVQVANVAPSGGGPNPQGLPPGTRESGSGAFVAPGSDSTNGQPQQFSSQDGPNPPEPAK